MKYNDLAEFWVSHCFGRCSLTFNYNNNAYENYDWASSVSEILNWLKIAVLYLAQKCRNCLKF